MGTGPKRRCKWQGDECHADNRRRGSVLVRRSCAILHGLRRHPEALRLKENNAALGEKSPGAVFFALGSAAVRSGRAGSADVGQALCPTPM